MRIPLAREGYPFIAAAALPVAFAGFFGLWWLFVLFFLLAFFVVWFFRDPERAVPKDPRSIVSPADGRVIKAEKVREDRLLNGEALKISIFMNVFNVHVNRMPYPGKIVKILYNPGKFISANLDKASLENEQNALLVTAEDGKRFVVTQIAGLIARRIVCRVKEGDSIEKGSRIGLIRFGSRLDVYLPPGVELNVRVGEKVKAGSSVLGYW